MKKLVTSYTFDASERTITSDDFTSLEKIQLITNVTDQIIIYNFADQTKGGTLALTVLTLEYDTTSMADGDKLQIFVEDGSAIQPVSGTVTANLSATDNAVLDQLELNQDAQTALLTSMDADTSTLAGAVSSGKVQVDVLSMPAGGSGLTDTELRATPVPVSGTVTANLSATDNAVLDAIAAAQLPDGHNVTVDNASLAVTGTFWQATQPISGTVTVDMGANNDVTVTSGSITANAGTNLNTSALALEAGGNLAAIKAKTDNIPALGQALAAASVPVILPSATITTLTPPAAITGFALAANQLPDGHNVTVDNPGDIGGGTQYTEGDVDATITGTAALVEGGANALAVLTQPLTDTQLRATPVPISGSVTADLGANNDVTVTSGSITATQATGTNLHVVVDSAPTTAVTGTFWQATQPVSGTVTANLSATDNAVLDQLELNQDAQTALLTTIDEDTGAIKTAVETLDNAISGSEMQVDIVASLPAGTNAIGKLSANSGVDIGDVDVASIATGTNAIGRVGHDVTGVGHGVKTVTTAGTDVALAASTACKKVDIQAQTDNTSLIAVGGSGVDATIATGTGIVLYPGDVYSLEIDNLADIYIDSLVNGEGVRFTYYT